MDGGADCRAVGCLERLPRETDRLVVVVQLQAAQVITAQEVAKDLDEFASLAGAEAFPVAGEHEP